VVLLVDLTEEGEGVHVVDHEALRTVAVGRLGTHVEQCGHRIVDVVKFKVIMKRKISQVIEYFGEDPKSCDTSKVFGVLQQFRWAVTTSKEMVERREMLEKRSSFSTGTLECSPCPSSSAEEDEDETSYTI
jgi:hypothetical protein